MAPVVRQAADGPTAVDTAERFAPDVILLDLNLPGMRGIDVCQRIRSFSDAYILMLTASDDLTDMVMDAIQHSGPAAPTTTPVPSPRR